MNYIYDNHLFEVIGTLGGFAIFIFGTIDLGGIYKRSLDKETISLYGLFEFELSIILETL